MTKITVGGEEYTIKPLNFKTLKKAFPIVQRAAELTDPMEIADASVQVIALAMERTNKEHTLEWLEENLSMPETRALGEVVLDLVKESGLVEVNGATGLDPSTEGNAESGEADLSTEISTPSSPNSSLPDAAAETGTL